MLQLPTGRQTDPTPAPLPGGGTPEPSKHRGRLFRKYVVLFVTLVTGALLTSGLIEIFFSYQENQAALGRLQREKAAYAAIRIEQFIKEIERLVVGAVQSPNVAGPVSLDQRRADYLRLLRQAAAVTELSYIDSRGFECLRVSRLAMNQMGCATDYSQDPRFLEARVGRPYFGPVSFRNESEPYMSISIAEAGPNPGVTVADVNLKFIWDVVSQIKIGKAGHAYVVDSHGQLIAHPDISLVLQRTDLSPLAQVQTALARPPRSGDDRDEGAIARDLQGRQILTASQSIDPPGWAAFVDQPLEEAFAPLYFSMLRTALLLLLGLGLSVVASLALARRMVTPIQALQAGAARIGAGALDQRIEVRTNDELEALAEAFNRMTAQLRESYANLEQKVDERTRDLAEALAQLEEQSRQLEIASKHKSEFLANMSHELRTPLNAIIGFSEVLLERMFGELNDKQDEYLTDILTSGKHLLSLINDILDLSKVEAGHMELELGQLSLPEALDNGLTMIKERASRHGIRLGLEVDPAVDLVEADERKVKQVVFNLLSNAVKFTPDGGRVDLAARQVGDEVHVSVRDTGIGIAPDDQERIFEEFRQAGRQAGRVQEGTGLGLALTRKFVELHGGRIWVESQLDVGSTFTFSLPLRRPAEAAGDEPPPEQPERRPAVANGSATAVDGPVPAGLPGGNGAATAAGGPTLLLVEDDPRSIDLLSLYLRGAGFEVVVAHDGEEGLRLARQLRPAAIVLDLLLPKVDGWDVLTRVKAEPALSDIPVVIVSMLDERGKGFALGAAEYIVKPVGRDKLLATLGRLTAAATSAGRRPTILAIDDDPMAIELIEAVLTPEGYEILKADGGQDGVELARRAPPDLVILDLTMPDVDGFMVVERLRADPTTAAIPIVILTSRSMTPAEKQRLNGQISYLARKGEFDRAAFVEMVRGFCPVAVS